jgi:NTP pyrophosphatase (non-canonical NTP hydrolase)
MKMNDYQERASETAIYPRNENWGLMYSALGLASEAGEYAGKCKKLLRDNVWSREAAASELGDVLWYVAACARDLGYDLATIAEANLAKLQERKTKGTIQGSGDHR